MRCARAVVSFLGCLLALPLIPTAVAAEGAGFEAERAAYASVGASVRDAGASGGAFWNLWSNGVVRSNVEWTAGDAVVLVRLRGTPLEGTPAQFVMTLDGTQILEGDAPEKWTWLASRPISVSGAVANIQISFINDARSVREDRNLHVDAVRIERSVAGSADAREAEAFATRSVGARVTASSASGRAYWNLWAQGHIEDSFTGDGQAQLIVRARGTPVGGAWPQMDILVDGTRVAQLLVNSPDWRDHSGPVLDPGAHVVRIAFINDARTASEDRDLHLDVVTLTRPGPAAIRSNPVEAESFIVRSVGAQQATPSASGGAFWNLWSNGYLEDVVVGQDAPMHIVARGTPANGSWPILHVTVDGGAPFPITVDGTSFRAYAGPVLSRGEHVLRLAFVNDARVGDEDRNLHLDALHGVSRADLLPMTTREGESFAIRTTGRLERDAEAMNGAAWNLWGAGHIEDVVRAEGRGTLVIRARGSIADGEWPKMRVDIDGVARANFTVARTRWGDHIVGGLTAGDHIVRISFLNDRRTPSEDRNLWIDAVSTSAARDVAPVLAADLVVERGTSTTLSLGTPAGDTLVLHARTPGAPNLQPTLEATAAGRTVRTALTSPHARPIVLALPANAAGVELTLRATEGDVVIDRVEARKGALPLVVDAVDAAEREGGRPDGKGWRFYRFGWIETPFVAPTTGWYELAMVGTTRVDTHPPLVHLFLDGTVVAEGFQSGTFRISARVLLQAGEGHMLGASFENPGASRWVRMSQLIIEPTTMPSPRPVRVLMEPPGTADWPQYGRDSWNTRSNPDPRLPTRQSVPMLREKWNTSVDASVTSTPAVVNGRVYVGTWNGSAYALDAQDGTVVWRTNVGQRIDASLAVASGLVIVPSGRDVVALDAATGIEKWRRTTHGHLFASPIVQGNDVFITVDSSPGEILRLDLATGNVRWQTRTTDVEDGGARIWATALVPPGAGLVIVGTSPGTPGSQPPTSDALLALDRETGAIVWVHQFFIGDVNEEGDTDSNRDFGSTPLLARIEGRPVVLAAQKHGPVWAVDLWTGALVHGGRGSEDRAQHLGSSAAFDGIHVTSSTTPERIAAFNIASGGLRWEVVLPGINFAPVAIGGGLAWIGTWAGDLHAFDLRTGDELSRVATPGGVLGGVALARGMLFVGGLEKPPVGGPYASLGRLPGFVAAYGST